MNSTIVINEVSSVRHRLADYLELTKPRLASLVLLTTAAGFWLGAQSPISLSVLAHLLAGTALVVGGANALNQWLERVPDALMQRTQSRPLPSGRLTPEEAHRFGFLTVMVGTIYLAVHVNGLTAALAAFSATSYLMMYTPLKRITSLCTLVGAIPGALPPMMGWAAARNSLGLEAWALFALVFVWQLPHFLAIAVLYRDDYARAGFRMLPVTESDGLSTARQTILYGLALLPVSLFPTLIGLGGLAYFIGALILSLLFFLTTLRAAWTRSRPACQQLFLASVLYLPLLLALLACDKQVGHLSATPQRVLQSELADYGELPEFSLTDEQGQPFTRATLQGHLWVADFIFTRCAGQCPMMSEQMAKLQRSLERLHRVAFVSFSVDPRHDTPSVLSAYAARYRTQTNSWSFVTGDSASITRLAKEGFRLGVGEGDSPVEPITHSVRLVLIDPQGHIRGYYDATEAQAMTRLRDDIQHLLERAA